MQGTGGFGGFGVYGGMSAPTSAVGGMGGYGVYGAMGAPPGGFMASMFSPMHPSTSDQAHQDSTTHATTTIDESNGEEGRNDEDGHEEQVDT